MKTRQYIQIACLVLILLTSCRQIEQNDEAQSSNNEPQISISEAQSSVANELQAALDEWRESSEIAGAVLAIDAPGQERLILVSGVSDIEAGTPLSPDDRFRIGSVTKTFVAAVVMQLAEEGLLELDDPLSAYVPDFPDAENITVRHLLSHQSGIFDFEFAPGLIETAFLDPTDVWTTQDVIETAISQEPLFAPGTDFAYSSTNFTLLGMIVEAVTGNSLNDEMDRRIIKPLGLTNTFLAGSEEAPEGVIHGYGMLPDGTSFDIAEIPNTVFDTASWATGSMVSTAGDVTDWAKTFYSGKSEIVGNETLDEMLTVEPSSGPSASVSHGLGVFRYETPAGVAFGHTGTWFGFSSRMMYFPDLDVSLVVLVNQHFMDTSPIADAAMEIVNENK